MVHFVLLSAAKIVRKKYVVAPVSLIFHFLCELFSTQPTLKTVGKKEKKEKPRVRNQ